MFFQGFFSFPGPPRAMRMMLINDYDWISEFIPLTLEFSVSIAGVQFHYPPEVSAPGFG